MTNKNKLRKTLITSYLLLLSFATIFSLYMPKNEATAQEETVIPNEAIRLRILANSDSEADQALKRKVRDAVNAEITEWVQDLTSLEEARTTIKSGLPEIQKIAEQVVAAENETQSVKVDFGKVEFPTKLYGQFLYPAGEYEAILITLGEGEGANWWCVLFPPLCFLDISNGVAVSEGFDEEQDKNSSTAKTVGEDKIEQIAQAESTQLAETVTSSESDTTDSSDEIEEAKTDDEQAEVVSKATVKQQGSAESDSEQTEEEKAETKENSSDKTKSAKKTDKESTNKTKKPVYTAEDEQEVEVKFFVVELWAKFF